MQLLGLTIARTKALTPPPALAGRGSGGWFPIVRESYPGAWQQNVEITLADVLTHPTVYACVSLIASDIAKVPVRLVAAGCQRHLDGNRVARLLAGAAEAEPLPDADRVL